MSDLLMARMKELRAEIENIDDATFDAAVSAASDALRRIDRRTQERISAALMRWTQGASGTAYTDREVARLAGTTQAAAQMMRIHHVSLVLTRLREAQQAARVREMLGAAVLDIMERCGVRP